MMKTIFLPLLTSIIAVIMTPAQAQISNAAGEKVYHGITIEEVAAVLDRAGYEFTQQDETSLEGPNSVFIDMGNCNEEGVCNDLGFSFFFVDVMPSVEQVNRWNFEQKMPRAILRKDGRLAFDMWITARGLTDEALIDAYKWFEQSWKLEGYFDDAIVETGA